MTPSLKGVPLFAGFVSMLLIDNEHITQHNMSPFRDGVMRRRICEQCKSGRKEKISYSLRGTKQPCRRATLRETPNLPVKHQSQWQVYPNSDYQLPAIIRCFLSYNYIMRMTFGHAGWCNTNKLSIILQGGYILRSAITHTCTQAAYKLLYYFV